MRRFKEFLHKQMLQIRLHFYSLESKMSSLGLDF